MRFYSIVLLSLILLSCQDSAADNKSKNEPTINKSTDTLTQQKSETKPKVLATNEEFISWDSVRVNGKLPMISKTKELFSLLGKPDSLVSPDMNDVCVSFYDKDFKYAYLNNSQIEIYGDTAVFGSLYFKKESKLYLKTPKHTFDRNTSLETLEKVFPNAVKEKYEVNDYDIGKAVAVRIQTSKEPSDDSWLLLFKNGKLIRIDYYMPC
ncbi:hypothetical protein [Rufibacter roseus]|uniref:Beta-lactamase-inhibitor-like PepSY-like domain-containing protein n=1 Tax=Rufibacter roseus TaxID=1567108 RepID=A0ABW2DR12_9BACT|nr:hypothetical protein [Rufibacter roseus]